MKNSQLSFGLLSAVILAGVFLALFSPVRTAPNPVEPSAHVAATEKSE
jgi:hypothetical protein